MLVNTISRTFLTLAQDPGFSLIILHKLCAALGIRRNGGSEHFDLLTALEACCEVFNTSPIHSLHSMLFGVEELSKPDILACAASHVWALCQISRQQYMSMFFEVNV